MKLTDTDVDTDDRARNVTVGCSSFASGIGNMFHTCIDKFIKSVENKYRMSRVKLDEWVIIEMEPDQRKTRTRQPSSQKIWLDLPDSDDE